MAAESINSKIQKFKRMACGFRIRERFRDAIHTHCGGRDSYLRLGSTLTQF
ncbi:MAG: transposase [Planctomycetes bacterium]|nr:transposase [Planctomycetota bacterium]